MPPGTAASSLPATAASSLTSLQQPLLPATSSNLEPAGTQAAAAAAAEAGHGAQPNALAPGAHTQKRHKEAAAWRVTLPGTIACTLALFVQKMVGIPCQMAGRCVPCRGWHLGACTPVGSKAGALALLD